MPGHEWRFVPGDPWAICDSCGFKKRRSHLRMRWDGFLVCSDTCWHPRQPQEFSSTEAEKKVVVNPRPPNDPVYVEYSDVDPTEYPGP